MSVSALRGLRDALPTHFGSRVAVSCTSHRVIEEAAARLFVAAGEPTALRRARERDIEKSALTFKSIRSPIGLRCVFRVEALTLRIAKDGHLSLIALRDENMLPLKSFDAMDGRHTKTRFLRRSLRGIDRSDHALKLGERARALSRETLEDLVGAQASRDGFFASVGRERFFEIDFAPQESNDHRCAIAFVRKARGLEEHAAHVPKRTARAGKNSSELVGGSRRGAR